jgi:anti-anti-sigma factor
MEKNLILIVDDEKEICAELSIFLSKKGFSVIVANNFKDAVAMFKSRNPMLVITDYHMPDGTGLDVLKKVKSINHSINVILMSGVADAKTAATAIKQDAFDFIPKPIDIDELERVIKQAVERTLQSDSLKLHKKGELLITHHEIDRGKKISILYLNRNLDEYTAESYKITFLNYLNASYLNDNVIIDLKNVVYINNVGLNLLINIADLLNERNKNFFMCNPANTVSYYINTLGYGGYLKLEILQEDAIAKI